MTFDKKTEEFYERLSKQLHDQHLWPTVYLFKFIVPAQKDNLPTIETIFSDTQPEITTKTSSKGNFTSVSIKAKMKNPAAVIEKYKAVSHIEGIVSL